MQTASPEPGADKGRWWALLGIAIAVLMFTLDTSIVNVALPRLVENLDTTFAHIQWVVLSYLLVIVSLVLGAARLGDIYGKKRLYQGGLILFTISSALCGFAPTINWLIAARALQGLGGVFVAALGIAIIAEVFPPGERGRALGIIASVVSLGIASGPTIGGLLIGLAEWRAIFLVNVPIGIVASLIIMKVIPADRRPRGTERFDLWGAVLAAASLGCFAMGMTHGQDHGFREGLTVALLALSVALLVVFVVVQQTRSHPMLELSIFHNAVLTSNLLLGFLVFVVLGGSVFLTPFFLYFVKGFGPEKVGILMAVSPVAAGLISPLAGSWTDRHGTAAPRFTGLVLMSVGCYLISRFDEDLTIPQYLLSFLPLGLGIGLFQSPSNAAIMSSVPRNRLGMAGGLATLARTLGQTIGMPLMGTVFGMVAMAHGATSTRDIEAMPAEAIVWGYETAFFSAAVATALAAAGTLVLWIKTGPNKPVRMEARRAEPAPGA